MQPVAVRATVKPQTIFQYPRSDRRRCNPSRPLNKSLRHTIFQYPRSDRRRCNENRTFPQAGTSGSLSVSSVGSEAMQHVCIEHPAQVYSVFQYPRSDRRRCNQGRWTAACDCGSSFSILGRIGGDATFCRRIGGRVGRVFQYPRSDRRRCNPPGWPGWARRSALSVSSVGSEAMQLEFIGFT